MHESIPPFTFAGLFGRPAACGLERIDLPDVRTVVIATEVADNPGVSVTNFAEGLARTACIRFGIDPDRLVWIEHQAPDPCPICQGRVLCSGCRGTGKRQEAMSAH